MQGPRSCSAEAEGADRVIPIPRARERAALKVGACWRGRAGVAVLQVMLHCGKMPFGKTPNLAAELLRALVASR